jgi:hypothetical protein
MRNRVRQSRTLDPVRGEAGGYGDRIRARTWKRRRQPRDYLRLCPDLSYSDVAVEHTNAYVT